MVNGRPPYSYKLFEKYGVDNCTIVLLEIVSCLSKDELHSREAYHIRNNTCINKAIPDRTHKEYLQDSKIKTAIKHKEYCQLNKDKINLQQQALRLKKQLENPGKVNELINV